MQVFHKKTARRGGGVGIGPKRGYVGRMEIDYLKIMAAVLAANLFTVGLVYAMTRIHKREAKDEEARFSYHFVVIFIVLLPIPFLYYL
jgi:hypothetical protein